MIETIVSPPKFASKTVAFMTKSPLSPAGVQSKMDELYSLNELQLHTEAMAIQADFKAWVKENFFLSVKQQAYLEQLNDQATAYFGSQCSLCFSNRLPIALIYPIPPGTDYTKWTGTANSLTVKSNGAGKPIATGKLTFEFSYFL